MKTCQRFESEGLQRFVAGEPLDAHFESCPDCRTARATYEALASALKDARDTYTPAGNWEAQVWARLQREGASRKRTWGVWAGALSTAAAAAVVLLVLSGGPETLGLPTVEVERGTLTRVRSSASRPGEVQSAAPGDVWHLLARVPRGKVGDVRVYRGSNELVFQCATNSACVHGKDSLEARVKLDKPGVYRTLAIAADKALPEATGNLDVDTAAALRAGSTMESAPLDVL